MVGSFAHGDVAGANRLRFSGRVGGHKLSPGSYRLEATSVSAAGAGKPALAAFKILR